MPLLAQNLPKKSSLNTAAVSTVVLYSRAKKLLEQLIVVGVN